MSDSSESLPHSASKPFFLSPAGEILPVALYYWNARGFSKQHFKLAQHFNAACHKRMFQWNAVNAETLL